MILTIWKPYGITSIQLIKQYQKEYDIKKITCVGRLDPLAQGELKILTDSDTKKMKDYLCKNKIYNFDLILGIETESHDCLSEIKNIDNELKETNETILKKIKDFTKTYTTQSFPLVSSFVISHDGHKEPLWWFYRNGYRNIQLPEKKIEIYNLNVNYIKKEKLKDITKKFMERINTIKDTCNKNEFQVEDRIKQWNKVNESSGNLNILRINIDINVSSGFYVRRFCHDFGKYLNSFGIAFDITRTNIY